METHAPKVGQKDKQVIKKRNLQIIEVLRERTAKNNHVKRDDEELLCYTGQVTVKKED